MEQQPELGIECPPQYLEEVLQYLDELRASGETNMFGARPYLQKEFEMTKQQATKFLSFWMQTYSARHHRSKNER